MMNNFSDKARTILHRWKIFSLACLVLVGVVQVAHGQPKEGLCAVCVISKTNEQVCYIHSRSKNDAHEVGHILNACGIDPCIKAVGIISIEEATKQKIPIKDTKHMSTVHCD